MPLMYCSPFAARAEERQMSLCPRRHYGALSGDFLESCDDIVSFAKNYFAVNFKLDYVKADGDISNYYPDFIVKVNPKLVVIVETKGREEIDLPQKMARLRQWCEDINRVQSEVKYDFVFVDQESCEKHNPKAFREILGGFLQYRNE